MSERKTDLPKCSYGCGKEAKKLFKNGKWCCSEHAQQCSVIKHRISNGLKSTLSKRKRSRKSGTGSIKIVATRNIYNSGFFRTNGKSKPKKKVRKVPIDRVAVQQSEGQYA